MPRLPHSLIWHASRRHRFLPLLLRECRDLPSAQNELRWLTEDALSLRGQPKQASGPGLRTHSTPHPSDPEWQTLYRNVIRRSRGEPLQYILGTQPFGDLEILCRKDVLIPRHETETYTVKLAQLVWEFLRYTESSRGDVSRRLRILDLCSGTGCIALLLYSLMHKAATSHKTVLEITAVDTSGKAIELGLDNLNHNVRLGNLHSSALTKVSFVQSDVLEIGNELAHLSKTEDTEESHAPRRETLLRKLLHIIPQGSDLLAGTSFDFVISNPPYISPAQYGPGGSTARSVRLFEPKLALVPPPNPAAISQHRLHAGSHHPLDQADLFYPAIQHIARAAGAKLLAMEVGDTEQGKRVQELVHSSYEAEGKREAMTELWRDSDNADAAGRAVIVWDGAWARWRHERTLRESITNNPMDLA